MAQPDRLRLALTLLRITVFVVMAMWSLDKLLRPDHAAAVFERFYYLAGVGVYLLCAIGIAQLVLELAFLMGAWKTITYGYVLVFHALSTVSSWRQYVEPFDNLLFLTALPMLGACVVLFLLRQEDTWLALHR